MPKEHLDRILIKHKAQPVGTGYIDIIIKQDKYQLFIQDLIETGFEIKGVSWWEWCEGENECNYGLGGPRSNYYNGWFAEIPTKVDDIELQELNIEESINKVIDLIQNKSIQFSHETVQFKKSDWLTPAIWLGVPDDWENKAVYNNA
nr:hypothetical protein [Allomuricauda sp.]